MDSVTAPSSGGRYVYDQDGVGTCEPDSPLPSYTPESETPAASGQRALVKGHDQSAKDIECALKAGKAGTTCALAVGAVVAGSPTLVGGVIAAFLSGAACGVEVVDTYLCYDGD